MPSRGEKGEREHYCYRNLIIFSSGLFPLHLAHFLPRNSFPPLSVSAPCQRVGDCRFQKYIGPLFVLDRILYPRNSQMAQDENRPPLSASSSSSCEIDCPTRRGKNLSRIDGDCCGGGGGGGGGCRPDLLPPPSPFIRFLAQSPLPPSGPCRDRWTPQHLHIAERGRDGENSYSPSFLPSSNLPHFVNKRIFLFSLC